MTRRRAVSVLEAASPDDWSALAAVCDLDTLTDTVIDARRRVVTRAFDEQLDTLRSAGTPVLVRYARRSAAEIEASRADLAGRIRRLSDRAREVLHHAQRHARDGEVRGSHTWDPVEDAAAVRSLLGAGLMMALPGQAAERMGRYRLHPDLPEPPPLGYAFGEAVMPRTDDLSEPGPGPVDLLHDLASLSAALSHHPPRRTLSGTLDKATVRKLGTRLGDAAVAASGDLGASERWTRALTALQALGAITMDPSTRVLSAEPDLEHTLEGTTAEAVDRMAHRLIDHELQAALPALRTALATADDQALDTMILFDELAEQHRELVFARWHREGMDVYPSPHSEVWVPFDREHFDEIEVRMLHELLHKLERLGLIVSAPGVIAATDDGRLWASGDDPPSPPVWVSSDLEVMVPPHSITPWERYQLERLGRTLARDVVDRYKLDRPSLETWLATHDLRDALGLLERRAAGLPLTVRETLQAWATSATRFVLTRGVLWPPEVSASEEAGVG